MREIPIWRSYTLKLIIRAAKAIWMAHNSCQSHPDATLAEIEPRLWWAGFIGAGNYNSRSPIQRMLNKPCQCPAFFASCQFPAIKFCRVYLERYAFGLIIGVHG